MLNLSLSTPNQWESLSVTELMNVLRTLSYFFTIPTPISQFNHHFYLPPHYRWNVSTKKMSDLKNTHSPFLGFLSLSCLLRQWSVKLDKRLWRREPEQWHAQSFFAEWVGPGEQNQFLSPLFMVLVYNCTCCGKNQRFRARAEFGGDRQQPDVCHSLALLPLRTSPLLEVVTLLGADFFVVEVGVYDAPHTRTLPPPHTHSFLNESGLSR